MPKAPNDPKRMLKLSKVILGPSWSRTGGKNIQLGVPVPFTAQPCQKSHTLKVVLQGPIWVYGTMSSYLRFQSLNPNIQSLNPSFQSLNPSFQSLNPNAQNEVSEVHFDRIYVQALKRRKMKPLVASSFKNLSEVLRILEPR